MLTTKKIRLTDYVIMLEDFESGWLYHDRSWLDTVHDGFDAEVIALLTEDSFGKAIAMTPLMQIRKGPFRLVGSPLRGMYTEFAGPLFAPWCDGEIRRNALVSQHDFLRSEGAGYIEWGWKGDVDSSFLDVLRHLGYKYVQRTTLVVDLGKGADQVWKGLQGRARNMVRKAEKNGVIVRSITPVLSDIQCYYEMLTETFRRQNIPPPHPLSFFQGLCSHLGADNHLEFIQAKLADRVVAGGIFLCFGNRMMYLSGTSSDQGARIAANSLVQWFAIKRAIDRGIEEYDMGGTGKDQIDKFKKSFGGLPASHQRWVYCTFPVKIAETAYSWLTRKGLVQLHA